MLKLRHHSNRYPVYIQCQYNVFILRFLIFSIQLAQLISSRRNRIYYAFQKFIFLPKIVYPKLYTSHSPYHMVHFDLFYMGKIKFMCCQSNFRYRRIGFQRLSTQCPLPQDNPCLEYYLPEQDR